MALSSFHRRLLAERGVSPSVARACGLRSADSREVARLTGVRGSPPGGLVIPYPDGRNRVRLDHPWRPHPRAKPARYWTPVGQRNALFWPPILSETILQGTEPLIYAEAELKVVALTAAGLPAVAGAGIYGWRNPHRRGGRFAGLADGFEQVNWQRRVVLLYDVGLNPQHPHADAFLRLGGRLLRLGATQVTIASVPALPDLPERCGPDDLIARKGRGVLERAIRLHVPARPSLLQTARAQAGRLAWCVPEDRALVPYLEWITSLLAVLAHRAPGEWGDTLLRWRSAGWSDGELEAVRQRVEGLLRDGGWVSRMERRWELALGSLEQREAGEGGDEEVTGKSASAHNTTQAGASHPVSLKADFPRRLPHSPACYRGTRLFQNRKDAGKLLAVPIHSHDRSACPACDHDYKLGWWLSLAPRVEAAPALFEFELPEAPRWESLRSTIERAGGDYARFRLADGSQRVLATVPLRTHQGVLGEPVPPEARRARLRQLLEGVARAGDAVTSSRGWAQASATPRTGDWEYVGDTPLALDDVELRARGFVQAFGGEVREGPGEGLLVCFFPDRSPATGRGSGSLPRSGSLPPRRAALCPQPCG